MDDLVCGLSEEQWVLDVGAGGGSFPYGGTPARIVALDLAYPAEKQPCAGHLLASSAKIPLRDGLIDVAVCNHTLEHFEELDGALQELHRVVRPGGRLWVSVPDGFGFDDGFYRFLFKGGGHVNRFTLDSLIRRVESVTGFRAREYQDLQTGFVYLKPPGPERLQHYPRRARILAWIPRTLLRRLVRSLNIGVRWLDRCFGTRLSRYGWAVHFTREEDQGTASSRPSVHLPRRPAVWNVCYECGSGNPEWMLAEKLEQRWLGQVYQCVRCGTVNSYSEPPEKAEPRSYQGRSLEDVAVEIFGSDQKAAANWLHFWKGGRKRSRYNLERLFEPLVLLDFRGSRVLDVGCGTGGMGPLLDSRGALYVGVDYHHHVLRFAEETSTRAYVQSSGQRLPFPDGSFQYIFAMDVLEHVQRGLAGQIQFLEDLKRVLAPLGMIFLSTPNRLHPREGHTDLFFPQYLPARIADWYVGLRRPGFLQEHGTFQEIRSLTPGQLRRGFKATGLAFLHQLPCGMDRPQFRKSFPLKGLLSWFGLGWYPHAEFWGILVRTEERAELRSKLKDHWDYVKAEAGPGGVSEFQSCIDFQEGPFSHQLISGWYWHERDRRGFRWTAERARCYLQSEAPAPFIRIRGYSPEKNGIQVSVDGLLIGERMLEAGQPFEAVYLIPDARLDHRIFDVEVRCLRTRTPGETDKRQLGVMLFSLEATDSLTTTAKTLRR